jgi:hypothetical protein
VCRRGTHPTQGAPHTAPRLLRPSLSPPKPPCPHICPWPSCCCNGGASLTRRVLYAHRAGAKLSLPVRPVLVYMQSKMAGVGRVTVASAVLLTAVLECVSAELWEWSGNAARDRSDKAQSEDKDRDYGERRSRAAIDREAEAGAVFVRSHKEEQDDDLDGDDQIHVIDADLRTAIELDSGLAAQFASR